MMKKLLTVLIAAATMVGAMAEVPSLINYQGRLKEKNGTNVNGTKNFTVRIFDAKTGGKQIYEENVGAVTINEGAYSFGFGEAGKSVVTPTEVLARTEGDKQVFNYITKNKPILGNVTISGAGLSWTDDDGSSDASKFTATINKNSGAASAIFLTQAPDSGTDVSISYDHNSDGVMGALSRSGQAWLGITVSGETLSPRERLVTVPFAVQSEISSRVSSLPDEVISIAYVPGTGHGLGYQDGDGEFTNSKNYYFSENGRNSIKLILRHRMQTIHNVKSPPPIEITFEVRKYDSGGNDGPIARKIIKVPFDIERREVQIELNDIPAIGFCRLSYTIDIPRGARVIRHGEAFVATYKK